MKKTLMVLGLMTAGAASAQSIQFSAAGSFTSGALGGFAGFTVQDVSSVGLYPLDLRFSADLASGLSFLNGDVLFNFPTDSANVYAGLGASFALSGANSSNLFGTATLGVSVPLTDQFGVFGEGALRYNGTFRRSALRVGVSYNF